MKSKYPQKIKANMNQLSFTQTQFLLMNDLYKKRKTMVIIVTSATLREKNKSNGKIITMYLLNKSKAVFFLLLLLLIVYFLGPKVDKPLLTMELPAMETDLNKLQNSISEKERSNIKIKALHLAKRLVPQQVIPLAPVNP